MTSMYHPGQTHVSDDIIFTMKPLQLAMKYMDIFFGDERMDLLYSILAEDCYFKGPYNQFDTAAAYIESLKADPPQYLSYQLIETFENETSACLVYQFTKPGISTTMSQTFHIQQGKISKILLVFDTADFA